MKFSIGLIACALLASAASAPALAQQEQQAAAPYQTISSETFSKASSGAALVDVREPSEWAQTGMPTSARGIPISSTDFVARVLAMSGGDKSKPVAVICRSGNRSVKAAQQLVDAGFTNVTNISDGMMGRDGAGKGWLAASLPTVAYVAAASAAAQ